MEPQGRTPWTLQKGLRNGGLLQTLQGRLLPGPDGPFVPKMATSDLTGTTGAPLSKVRTSTPGSQTNGSTSPYQFSLAESPSELTREASRVAQALQDRSISGNKNQRRRKLTDAHLVGICRLFDVARFRTRTPPKVNWPSLEAFWKHGNGSSFSNRSASDRASVRRGRGRGQKTWRLPCAPGACAERRCQGSVPLVQRQGRGRFEPLVKRLGNKREVVTR